MAGSKDRGTRYSSDAILRSPVDLRMKWWNLVSRSLLASAAVDLTSRYPPLAAHDTRCGGIPESLSQRLTSRTPSRLGEKWAATFSGTQCRPYSGDSGSETLISAATAEPRLRWAKAMWITTDECACASPPRIQCFAASAVNWRFWKRWEFAIWDAKTCAPKSNKWTAAILRMVDVWLWAADVGTLGWAKWFVEGMQNNLGLINFSLVIHGEFNFKRTGPAKVLPSAALRTSLRVIPSSILPTLHRRTVLAVDSKTNIWTTKCRNIGGQNTIGQWHRSLQRRSFERYGVISVASRPFSVKSVFPPGVVINEGLVLQWQIVPLTNCIYLNT